jgi:diguanylate cyclase (GGDEF)-like protein
LISRIKAALVREQQLARKDPLTGAGNRRAFFETAQVEIDRTHRYKRPFTLVYFDIDNFKKLNDTFGHETGDRVLRILVNTVHTNIRSTDIFARIGGDEFVLLLSETGFEQAAPVIAKIETLIIARLNAARLPVTLSTGAITFLRPPTTVDDLLKKTDSVMYTVKKAGKNRIKHIIWKESAIAH